MSQPSLHLIKSLLCLKDSDSIKRRNYKKKETILTPNKEKSQNNKNPNQMKKRRNKDEGSTALHFFFINKQCFHPTSQIAIYHKLGPDFFN